MSKGSKRRGWRSAERTYKYLTAQLARQAAAAIANREPCPQCGSTQHIVHPSSALLQTHRLLSAHRDAVALCVRCGRNKAAFTAHAPNGSWDAICRQCTTLDDRWFCGKYPCGLVYADRAIEEHGDYKRIAFISYSKLVLEIDDPNSPLLERVKADAARLQAMRGQQYQIAGNMSVTLGEGHV